MKKTIVALSFMALLGMVPASADVDCSTAGRIDVTGYGMVEGMPDLAVLNFSASVIKTEAKDARYEVETQVSAFIAALKKLGISSENIISSSQSIYPRYSYIKNEDRKFDGYECIRDVTVKVSNFAIIDKVASAAVESGISNIQGFYYEIKDVSKLQKEADALAMKDAKDKAKRLADGFDVDLGDVCSLSFGSSSASYGRAQRAMMMSNAADSAPVHEYAPDKQVVDSTVSASYAID